MDPGQLGWGRAETHSWDGGVERGGPEEISLLSGGIWGFKVHGPARWSHCHPDQSPVQPGLRCLQFIQPGPGTHHPQGQQFPPVAAPQLVLAHKGHFQARTRLHRVQTLGVLPSRQP